MREIEHTHTHSVYPTTVTIYTASGPTHIKSLKYVVVYGEGVGYINPVM